MLFLHIPKTAGTSLRTGVADFLGKNRMVLDYGEKQEATSELVKRWRYKEANPAKFRQLFDVQGKKFLSGHIRLADYVGGFDIDNIAVILRDPIQRIISEFRHYVRNYGYTGALEEFVKTPVFQNKQSRALAGVPIEQIGLVGLTEHYDESLRRLNEHFGWKIPGRLANVGRADLSHAYTPNKAVRDLIERNNPLDIQLYDRAVALFHEWDKRPAPTASGAVGSCRVEHDKRVAGWACTIGGEHPTRVRIEVNGKRAGEVIADRFRPDIQRRGLKRSGCAGFEFDLIGIGPGDEIRCIETSGGTELNNSPLRLMVQS